MIAYPDVSHFQAGLSLRHAVAAAAKATQGGGFIDPEYGVFRAQAHSLGIPFIAYHWLDTTDATAQARHAYAVVGADTPLMIDDEQPPINVAHTLAFVAEYRRLGGVVVLEYLPRWVWDQSGRPSLRPLARAGLAVVASNYNPSAGVDGGAGWAPYGGVSPAILQYTDRQLFNGQLVDMNRFPGTVQALQALLAPGHPTPPPPPPPPPHPKGDTVLTLLQVTGQSAVYVTDGIHYRWVQTGAELNTLRYWGTKNWGNLWNGGQIVMVSPADLSALGGVLVGPDPTATPPAAGHVE